MSANKKLKVTLMRSVNKKLRNHKESVKGLGLRRIRDVVEVEDTAAIRGLINKVSYLLKVEEI